MKFWTPKALEAARHLLWHYRQPGGTEPGSFTKNLIRAIELADDTNRATLLNAFPEYKLPVHILKNHGSRFLAEHLDQHPQINSNQKRAHHAPGTPATTDQP